MAAPPSPPSRLQGHSPERSEDGKHECLEVGDGHVPTASSDPKGGVLALNGRRSTNGGAAGSTITRRDPYPGYMTSKVSAMRSRADSHYW
jgi:hypothetical protein